MVVVYVVIAGFGIYSDRCESLIGVFLSADDAETHIMQVTEDMWDDFEVYEAEIGQEPNQIRYYERPEVHPGQFMSERKGRPVLIPQTDAGS